MAYKGEHMYNCQAVPFDWKNASLIIVSGSKPNPCGHALARAGNYYFHIDGAREYPWYMAHAGYLRYLKENEKTELRRVQHIRQDIVGRGRRHAGPKSKQLGLSIMASSHETILH